MIVRKSGRAMFKSRMTASIVFFAAGFAVIAARLVDFALWSGIDQNQAGLAQSQPVQARPDLVDRRGRILATDIETASLYADPRKLVDIDEAVEMLSPILKTVPRKELRRRLMSKRAFIWLKRELSPRQEAAIHNLGIAGLGFVRESRRVYPTGAAAAHILGHVNVDNEGIAGAEKYVDRRAGPRRVGGPAGARKPVTLAVDLNAQHALRDELLSAMQLFNAKGAAGIVMDVMTGELVALSSLPDYNPNRPKQALDKKNLNKALAGVYELGSTFKLVTTAMALDTGNADLDTKFDARAPLRAGNFTIRDFHAKRRVLTVTEVFLYSSNIGSARMAMKVGIAGHKAFLKKLGFLDRLATELPEAARPIAPRKWKLLNSMTIAFGHGLSVTPLHLAAAAAALVNGGRYVPPTFLKRDAISAIQLSRRVIKPATSAKLRHLMALNVLKGTARRAKVAGLSVGGKTGTAEKVINGRYSKNTLLTSFLGMFPADKPRYVVLIMLDEPKGTQATQFHATSSWNAVPTAGRVIARIAPLLGVFPKPAPQDPER
jgi:cell division protein FtsI (penicillin-binding protein 3)